MDNNENTPPAEMQKTSTYFQTIVAFHNLRDRARETAESWQERGLSDRLHDGWNSTTQAVTAKTKNFFTHPEDVHCEYIPEKYNYVFRPKSRLELILLSGTVCGIEFCYAAETAFVTPILLSLGLSIKFVTMIWCLSPLIGLFLTPFLGSMSDSCESKWGRRRPFIIMYSIGIILGLLLVPNGQHIGLALGDERFDNSLPTGYPKIMLNGTSENGNAIKLNQVNESVSNKFYPRDFDDTTKNSVSRQTDDNDLVRNKRSSLLTVSGPNVPIAIKGIKNGYQNIDPIFAEDETDNTDINKDEYLNLVDEFSNLIEKDGVFPEANHYGIKTPSSNKYSRKIDDADIYPSLQFGRMNSKSLNKDSENDGRYTEPQKSDISEDEYSILINKESNNINKLPLRTKPTDRLSRRIDDDDIYPNLRFRGINAINQNIESENGKYIQSQKYDVLKNELSQPINKENGFSMDLSMDTKPTATQRKNAQRYAHSQYFSEEDVYPKFSRVQRNEPRLPKIQANPEKLPKSTLSPEIQKSTGRELDTTQTVSELPAVNDQNDPPFTDGTGSTSSHVQTWSVVFTVIGTVLLDFCSDACQSPSRTYLLDVTIPSDHAAGLSTFTVMAGFGGAIGYAMGALHWENTYIGQLLGGQVNTVFLIVTVIFLICLVTTVTSFPEIPLCVLKDPKMYKEYREKFQSDFCPTDGNELERINNKPKRYGSMDEDRDVNKTENASISVPATQNDDKLIENECIADVKSKEKDLYETIPDETRNTTISIAKGEEEIVVVDELGCANEHPTLKEYLTSILHMPNSLRVLCLTNLFCWMSLVCYSLYFTDFVGESVFGGDPQAPEGSASFLSYQNGVQFGCWGMALYSISCSIYSLFIESFIKKVGARQVYIGGQLVYSVGMVIMAITRHKVAVILLSPTAGIMYSTLFTMPYLLIAHYHCNNQFSDGKKGSGSNTRGIGTDVAAVSSMVFLSQFILSLSMGSIIEAIGSNVVPVCAAALLSACGAISATQVTYLNI